MPCRPMPLLVHFRKAHTISFDFVYVMQALQQRNRPGFDNLSLSLSLSLLSMYVYTLCIVPGGPLGTDTCARRP